MNTIKKRDGRIVPFSNKNISSAILRAAKSTNEFQENIADSLTQIVLDIAQKIFAETTPTVEEIQDIVEDVLLKSPYKKTAKAYIIYREQHTRLREITSSFNIRLVDQYLQKKDWQVNENSNMDYSLQGLNNYISTEISKSYWLNEIYPDKIRDAHVKGDLHIHDLGLLSVYCVGWDLYDLISNGFQGAPGKIESLPAKHFRTALGQITNFFYTLQGEAAGAQAFSNFDTLLAPFIFYDKLNYSEVKQALQEFLFNVNVPTRVGFQTPFTNITLDLTVPSYYAEQGVMIGGKQQEKTYKEFQTEINIFNKAFLEIMAEGDAKGRVFTFPIPTYNITKDFDWDNPYLEKLWEVTAKYGIPYFANFINSDMQPEDARSMCCRLRIDNRKLEKRGGGLFGSAPLTGSVGVVTINLPRIGSLAGSEEDFFARLSALMNIAKDSLEIKRKTLERLTESGLYPYTKHYLKNIKLRFDEYWKNHFSTIGIVGMNEACLNFFGENIASEKGREFSLRVMDYMRNKLTEFQAVTGNNYNLEATPAEGTSYRLALADQKILSNPFFANTEDAAKGLPPFYTNSSFLPVDYSDDLFEILDLQDDFQAKYTGGTVLHLFIGERINDTKALTELIKTISNKYKLPYFSITPTFSVCPVCGYLSGEHETCDKCGSECEIYSRVVGYLRPVKQWNEGKREEFKLRKTAALQ
jgi:ribonucleoside-triphosphate reductase (formate)